MGRIIFFLSNETKRTTQIKENRCHIICFNGLTSWKGAISLASIFCHLLRWHRADFGCLLPARAMATKKNSSIMRTVVVWGFFLGHNTLCIDLFGKPWRIGSFRWNSANSTFKSSTYVKPKFLAHTKFGFLSGYARAQVLIFFWIRYHLKDSIFLEQFSHVSQH